jgi:cytochrome c-type biogenesis protein CcmH
VRVFFPGFFVALLLGSPMSFAVIETYEFTSPDLELRYKTLSFELRCPKCQNQNIADSDAPIAKDLRRLLHQQLEAGSSDTQIQDFMVARYGEFVLYRPRFAGPTIMLWLAPVFLFICAAGVVFVSFRRRSQLPASTEGLSEDERRRLQNLLDDKEGPL